MSVTFDVAVAWTTQLTGVFTIGSSLIGGTDVLAGAFGSEVFDDVTPDVSEVVIRRGRSDDLGQLMAGSATIRLHDPDGTYNSLNPSSAIHPNVRPMRPVRVRCTLNGATYTRFLGYITRIGSNPSLGTRDAVIEAVDLFVWLQRTKPTIASTGATTTGAAIGKVLDAIGFTETALRSLDTGDSISDFEADGTTTALDLIKNLLTAERGMFYVSAAGVATYESRYARWLSPRDGNQATFASTMRALVGEVDVAQIYNDVRVTRTGGAEQQAEDTDSQHAYAVSTYVLASVGYLPSDAVALSLARYILNQAKDPKQPLQLVLNNQSEAVYAAWLALDLSDRVGVSDSRGGTTGSFYVEHHEERLSKAGSRHTVDWRLTKRPTNVPLIIGPGVIGDHITY